MYNCFWPSPFGQAPCSQRKHPGQDQMILILFSFFYKTKTDHTIKELNGTYKK
jgi:hypothetical protein